MIKFKKDKVYLIKWLDHSTCYYSWTNPKDMDLTDYSCESVGFIVNETDTAVFMAQNRAAMDGKVTNVMQIIKSAIVKIQKISK